MGYWNFYAKTKKCVKRRQEGITRKTRSGMVSTDGEILYNVFVTEATGGTHVRR